MKGVTFQIGDYVKFKHTGEDGEIRGFYADGMIRVFLYKDDMEIPSFPDEIVLAEAFTGIVPLDDELQKLAGKKKKEVIPQKSTAELFFSEEELAKLDEIIEQDNSDSPASQKEEEVKDWKTAEGKSSNSGLSLAFHLNPNQSYTVSLINDSNVSLSFDFTLYLQQYPVQELRHKITPFTHFPIGELRQDQLNDSPVVEFSAPSIGLKKSIRIKARQFFQKKQNAPLLGISAHVYELSAKPSGSKAGTSDLKAYTKANSKPQKDTKSDSSSPFAALSGIQNPESLASFSNELDLHIQNLNPKYKNLDSTTKFLLQLRRFDQYIEEARFKGVSPVYIIHGLGKGKLKDEIHRRLDKNSNIDSFKNEHHPKYGFGATEVFVNLKR